jgi:hypothetical protein
MCLLFNPFLDERKSAEMLIWGGEIPDLSWDNNLIVPLGFQDAMGRQRIRAGNLLERQEVGHRGVVGRFRFRA